MESNTPKSVVVRGQRVRTQTQRLNYTALGNPMASSTVPAFNSQQFRVSPTNSIRSVASSATRTKELELERDKKKAELEEELEEKQLKLSEVEHTLHAVKTRLQQLEAEYEQNGSLSDDQLSEKHEFLKKLVDLEMELGIKKSELEILAKRTRRNTAVVEKEFELGVEQLNDEVNGEAESHLLQLEQEVYQSNQEDPSEAEKEEESLKSRFSNLLGRSTSTIQPPQTNSSFQFQPVQLPSLSYSCGNMQQQSAVSHGTSQFVNCGKEVTSSSVVTGGAISQARGNLNSSATPKLFFGKSGTFTQPSNGTSGIGSAVVDNNVPFGVSNTAVSSNTSTRNAGFTTTSSMQNISGPKVSFGMVPTSSFDIHPTKSSPFVPNNSSGNADVNAALIQLMERQMSLMERPSGEGARSEKELPTFSGHAEEWAAFATEYIRTTSQYNIQNSENLRRLRKALKSPAADTVKSLMANPDNVNVIMQTLEIHYGRPEQVIRSLIKKATEAKSPELAKPETWISFAVIVESLLVNILTYNCSQYVYDGFLLDRLVEKLPIQMQREWIVWVRGKYPQLTTCLSHFSEWMNIQRETACIMSRSEVAPKSEERRNFRGKRGHGVAINAMVEEKQGCAACGKPSHQVSNCYLFKKKNTEERWNIAKEKGLCFSCLNPDHTTRSCQRAKQCTKESCTSFHHQLLHREGKKEAPAKGQQDAPKEENKNDGGNPTPTASTMNVAKSNESLPVIPVELRGPKGIISIYALLDTGASCSVLEDSVAEKIGLEGELKPFKFTAFGEDKREEMTSKTVNVEVCRGFKHYEHYPISHVRTVKKLGIPGSSVNVTDLKAKFPHLQSVKVKSTTDAKPQMIIGFNSYRLFAPRKIVEKRGDPKAPIAFLSNLGWYICEPKVGKSVFMVHERNNNDEVLHELVKNFFTTESFGVKVVSDCSRSKQDIRALDILEKTTVKQGDRWETGLLWKTDTPIVPESKKMALRRLRTMEKKMDSDVEFAKLCTERFEDYIRKGYLIPESKIQLETSMEGIEISSTECTLCQGGESSQEWFLPWFFAVHPNKKPRLVFDAAAKSQGSSLNDFLLKGPDFIQPLPCVLMRSRIPKILIIGDISEMFHNVKLRKEDQQFQKILYRGMERDKEPEVYLMSVLFFGSASSASAAIYVKDQNAKQFEGVYPTAVKYTRRNEYMDDHMSGADTVEDAIKLRKEITEIHGSGGFPIRKWNSSSQEVRDSIPEEHRSEGIVNLREKSEIPIEKTLGIGWDPENDVFRFKLSFSKVPKHVLDGSRRPTKREMTSLVMSLFDPLGFIAPLKVKAMVMLQDTWRAGVGWDDDITTPISDKWNTLLREIPILNTITVPRSYTSFSLKTALNQLHVFCDASEEAFATCVYLRSQKDENVEVSFVCGKVRVAPVRGLTIPRMELQAALMGSRLSETTNGALTDDIVISKTVYWSDSKTVLCWLRSESARFNTFVGSRVGEILERTNVNDWRWVPTTQNVADDATRSDREFTSESCQRWLSGPEFLMKDENQWPQEESRPSATPETEEEMKTFMGAVFEEEEDLYIPEVTKFSCWVRLIRATAARWAAARAFKTNGRLSITVEDMEKASKLWMRKCQADLFTKELKCLRNGQVVDTRSSLYQLSPTLNEEGFIVCDGRIANAEGVPESVKFPPILHPKHPYARLYVNWIHRMSGHFGQERVVNEIRRKVWMIDCREAVRRCKFECKLCQFKKAKPVPPEMGLLPAARLESGNPPFHHVGVDYFGPYCVTINRKRQKRWGVLLTCMTTRAVHLELAESLDTSDMLNALVRFMNTRGYPAHIWSDNGTNFVGAEREIQENLKIWQQSFEQYLSVRGVQWHFIPPASPHMGGSWERLVGSTKKILGVLLKEQAPKEGVLRTLFSEVMNILNSRPLTYASPDPMDDTCLTPNHLMRLNCMVGPTIHGIFDEGDQFRKSWRHAQYLADQFWKRWSKEYLPQLAKRQKWHGQAKPLRVGDIVVVLDDQAPRNAWKRGIIVRTFPGKKGQTRIAEVKVTHVDPRDKKKEVKVSVLKRPTVKVCPLSL